MKIRSVWSGRGICEGAAARAKTARHDPSQKSLFLFCTITGIFASKENIYLLMPENGGGVWRRLGGSGSESSESTKELVSRWIVEQIAALKDTTVSDKTQFYSPLTA